MESWRFGLGGRSQIPRRRSTEEPLSERDRSSNLDFSDVFGGPPQSLLSRHYRSRFRSNSFYQEVFLPPQHSSSDVTGWRLPVFNIPSITSRDSDFYGDIFGSDEDRPENRRSVFNSKSTNSSSVLSPEDFTPFLNSSTLRPINVPKKHGIHAFPSPRACNQENNFVKTESNEQVGCSSVGYSGRASSPETMKPNSYRSIKLSVGDLGMFNSPSPSVISSICQDTEPPKARRVQAPRAVFYHEQNIRQEDDDDDEEVMSSYVDFTPNYKEGIYNETDAIDEAIAWAKETFRTKCLEKGQTTNRGEHEMFSKEEGRSNVYRFSDGHKGTHGSMKSIAETGLNKWTSEDEKQSEKDNELDLLDEDIRLWSAGKEVNIRVLLSSLHHILWPNSGWQPIPLTDLIESTNVKKAYQRARLCLHPDKLQQRGATVPQKYVSEKAFSILQDAWAAFITQDVFFG